MIQVIPDDKYLFAVRGFYFIFCFLCLSDVGSGSFGPHSVHRPSKSVASLHLQQWLPAVTS